MDYVRSVPVIPDRGSATARALLEGIVVHIPDVQADTDYTFSEAQRLGDFRTALGVPMLREGIPGRRHRPDSFRSATVHRQTD